MPYLLDVVEIDFIVDDELRDHLLLLLSLCRWVGVDGVKEEKGRSGRPSSYLRHLLLPVEGVVIYALLLAGQRLLLLQHVVLVRFVDFFQQVHHAWVRVQHQCAEFLVTHLRNPRQQYYA